MLLGVPKVIGWSVWMGLMSAFQIWCEVSGKMNTFLILLAFLLGSMSAVSEIRVFCGWIWRFSGPRQQRIMAFSKFVSFWVGFLAFLWSKVTKNHGVPKIHVFLYPEMLKFRGVGELSCWGHKLEI